MAELKCMVETCVHNQDKYCCKGDIMVGGKHAQKSDETYCDSFLDRKHDAYMSSMEHPSRHISIDCEATSCCYNTNYRCHASHVDVKGSTAKECHDTACGTYDHE